MRSTVFNRLMTVNVFIAAVYAFFSALALFTAPESLIVTQRHEYVFDHIAGRNVFGVIYLVIGLLACVAFAFVKARFAAFMVSTLISLFWSSIAVIPALTGVVQQGNMLGAIAGYALSILWFTTGLLCFSQYNVRRSTS